MLLSNVPAVALVYVPGLQTYMCTALQSQKAVAANLKSKQLLPFRFAPQYTSVSHYLLSLGVRQTLIFKLMSRSSGPWSLTRRWYIFLFVLVHACDTRVSPGN